MHELVFLHVGLPQEGLVAFAALEGFDVGVDESMGGQTGHSLEVFPTNFTVVLRAHAVLEFDEGLWYYDFKLFFI